MSGTNCTDCTPDDSESAKAIYRQGGSKDYSNNKYALLAVGLAFFGNRSEGASPSGPDLNKNVVLWLTPPTPSRKHGFIMLR